MKEIRKCTICGKPFTAIRSNSKYCGESCYQEGIRRRASISDKNKRKRAADKKRKTDDNRKSLSDYAAAARAAGMSYGERQKQETLERMARRA